MDKQWEKLRKDEERFDKYIHYHQIAYQLFKEKKYQEALDNWKKAIKYCDGNLSPYRWQGECLYKLSRYKDALIVLNNYVEARKQRNDPINKDTIKRIGIIERKLAKQKGAK